MTQTIIPFNPSINANFQFQATLDEDVYNVICTFNAYGQRYYVNVYDLAQNLVFSRPAVASPDTFNISLTIGFFTTVMIYRESLTAFIIDPDPILVPVTSRPPVPAPPPPPPPPPPPTDPYYSDVILLLHFDGENQGTAIVDNGPLNNAMAVTGTSVMSADEYRFPPTSLLTRATNNGCVHLASGTPTPNMYFGNQEFTVEFWMRPTSTPGGGRFIFNSSSGNADTQCGVYFDVAHGWLTVILVEVGGSTVVANWTTPPTVDEWTFVQIRRRNAAAPEYDYLEIGVNGAAISDPPGLIFLGQTLIPATDYTVGGINVTTGACFPGFVDDFRLTVGVAREFDLPTEPFPNS